MTERLWAPLLGNERAARSRSGPRALIVGAGISGLAAGLALVRDGWSVELLERRKDPWQAGARSALDAAQAEIQQAIGGGVQGEPAAALLERARSTLGQYWGTRKRNVVLDSHSVRYLAHLGVDDADSVPPLDRLDLSWGPENPDLSVSYPREPLGSDASVDGASLVHRRDWAALPSIDTLEGALRRALERHAGATVRFESTVRGVALTDTGAEVTYMHADADGVAAERLDGELVVIADGGGPGSLAASLGIDRQTVAVEQLDVCVFDVSNVERVLGEPRERVFGAGQLDATGWRGVASNGRRLMVHNATLDANRAPAPALVTAAAMGVDAPVVETSGPVRYAIDAVRVFAPSPRVLIAGDAAMRGSPLVGLGAQYGLVWSTLVADQARRLVNGDVAADDGYQRAASAAVARRLRFESACLDIATGPDRAPLTLHELVASPRLLQRVTALDYTLRLRQGRGRLRLRLGADLGDGPLEAATPEVAALWGLGVTTVTMDLAVRIERGELAGTLSGADSLVFETALETVRVVDGHFSLTSEGGWTLTLTDARLVRSAKATADSPPRERGMRSLTIRFPDAFLAELGKLVTRRLGALGPRAAAPLEIDLELEPNETLWLGEYGLAFSAGARARLRITPAGDGTLNVHAELLSGVARPVRFTRFARRVGVGPMRWLAAYSRLTLGLGDALMDGAAAALATMVRRVSLELRTDGSALVTYHGWLSVPVYLSADDVERLRAQLFGPAVLRDDLHSGRLAVQVLEVRAGLSGQPG